MIFRLVMVKRLSLESSLEIPGTATMMLDLMRRLHSTVDCIGSKAAARCGVLGLPCLSHKVMMVVSYSNNDLAVTG